MGVKIASARHLLSCHRKTQVAVFTRGLSVYRITIVSSCSLFVNRESLKNDSRFFFCSTSRNNSNSFTIQWGKSTGAVSFPRTFSSVYSVVGLHARIAGGDARVSGVQNGTISTSGFAFQKDEWAPIGSGTYYYYWIATGIS